MSYLGAYKPMNRFTLAVPSIHSLRQSSPADAAADTDREIRFVKAQSKRC